MKEKFYSFNQEYYNKNLLKLHMCGTSFWNGYHIVPKRYSTVGRIEYIIQGSVTMHLDNTVYHAEAGDCYFLQPYHTHEYFNEGKEMLIKQYLNLSGPLLDSLISGYRLKNTICFPTLDISDEMNQILDTAKHKEKDSTVEIIRIVSSIMHKMYHHTHFDDKIKTDGTLIKEYIDKCIYTGFDINKLSAIMKKSESQLRRNFKKEFGISPYEYFLQQKTEKAKYILRNTDVQIKQIAYDLNFADEYYFSTTFKSRTGYSPSEYRKLSAKT